MNKQDTVLVFGHPTAVETAALWFCQLNSYEWPDDFPLKKPDDYDGLTDAQKSAGSALNRAFNEMLSVVPAKERSRMWNLVWRKREGGDGGMTESDWEDWWNRNKAA